MASHFPTDIYKRLRVVDLTLAVIVLLVAFILIGGWSTLFGAESGWSHNMAEHGQWKVGNIIAVCDGSARVYAVRGDTGVALWVEKDGCDGSHK